MGAAILLEGPVPVNPLPILSLIRKVFPAPPSATPKRGTLRRGALARGGQFAVVGRMAYLESLIDSFID